MRSREFLPRSLTLVEGLMKYGDYLKDYYWPNFLEGVDNGMPYAFQIGSNNVLGTILDGSKVSKEISKALRSTDPSWFLKRISFSVQILDDEGEPTGETADNVKLTQIFKDEKIKGALKPNLGNVSEVILGCAVAAKFEKQGADITFDDLINVGQRLADGKGVLVAKAGKDSLTVKATVPFTDRKAFFAFVGKDSKGKSLEDYGVPESTLKKLDNYTNAAVTYANTSKRVVSAIQRAQKDPRKNQVDVISDGGEKANQNITKVDLKILFDGTNINLLSVKAGNVAQFGQVTGHNFEHLKEFFETTLGVTLTDATKSKFKEIPFGVQGPKALEDKERNFYKSFGIGYRDAFKQTKSLANTNQQQLFKQIYRGLLYHLTKNEEGVEMVILAPNAKKAFSELSFGKEFETALSQLRLDVVENHTENAYYLEVYGYPITNTAKKVTGTSKEKLITLWSSIRDGVIRNRVGMGQLLKDLADLENYIEKQQAAPVQQKPASVAVKPVAQAPVPASIQNQTKQIGAKIPMGQEPPPPPEGV